MSNAYYQVRVEEEDEQNNTITAGLLGAWQVKVMLQGDCNAPATMMRIMNTIFSDHLGDFIWIYLDDIVIFSDTKKDHIRHLRHVFDTLRKYEFYLRMDKCNLMTDEINLLGHTIRGDSITPTAEHSGNHGFQTTKRQKQLQKFLEPSTISRSFVAYRYVV
jgi:hypothetical protein